MEKLSKNLAKIVQTRYNCSFIPLPPSPTSLRPREYYAAYRFYTDPPGEMTLMWTETSDTDGYKTHMSLSCIKESGVWIVRVPISNWELYKLGEETTEYKAFESLLKESVIQSN